MIRLPHAAATIIGAVAAIVVLACGSGTTSSSGGDAPAPQDNATSAGTDIATVKVGETLTIKSFGSEYTVTVRSLKQNVKSGNQFTQPENGQFITFEAEVVVKDGSVFASPGLFALETAQGTVYSWALAVLDDVDQSWSVELHVGQNKKGMVVIDAPKDLAGAKIFVQELDKPAGYWTF